MKIQIIKCTFDIWTGEISWHHKSKWDICSPFHISLSDLKTNNLFKEFRPGLCSKLQIKLSPLIFGPLSIQLYSQLCGGQGQLRLLEFLTLIFAKIHSVAWEGNTQESLKFEMYKIIIRF